MRQLTPDVPMNADVLTEVDLAAYTAALERSVFWSCLEHLFDILRLAPIKLKLGDIFSA